MNLTPYIGIPYVPKGELPHGLDCWTLVRTFASNELGIALPDFFYDPAHLQETAAERITEEVGPMGHRWQQVSDHRLGDVCLFRMRGLVSHCAVVIDELNILHTIAGRMSCIEPLDAWRQRLSGIYRWNPHV